MTTLGVIDIYDRIKRSNGQYCKLCFRTADERKLVDPVSLKLFLNAVNSSSLCKGLGRACYVCEARAASALRVRHAVALAEALGELFEWLDAGSDGLRTAVLDSLAGKRKAGGRACRRAAQCAAALRRAGPGLARSDTLVVCTDAPQEASATHTVLTDIPNHVISEGAVSIKEECAPTAAPAPLCAGGDVTVLRDQMRLAVPDARRGCLVMHPMMKGSDGNVYVPSLKLQVGEDNVLKSISDHKLFLYTNTPLPIQSNEATNKEPVVLQTTQTDVGDFQDFLNKRDEWKNNLNVVPKPNILNYELNSKEMVQNRPSNKQPFPRNIQPVPRNIQPGPRNIQPGPRNIQPVPRNMQCEPSNIQHGPSNIQHEGSESQHGAIEGGRGAELKRGATQPVANGMAESKRPVLSIGKVDWENKIPMDVISFMDANDPNPSERIMQPDSAPALAVISDVRTLDAQLDDDVVLVDNVECIDLC